MTTTINDGFLKISWSSTHLVAGTIVVARAKEGISFVRSFVNEKKKNAVVYYNRRYDNIVLYYHISIRLDFGTHFFFSLL